MELILYHFESCPYCEKVRRAIRELQIPGVRYRDALEEPEYRDELIKMNGTRQVPCLVVDGTPVLESDEIVAFLKRQFGPKK
ncbi:MAG: glutathione S-transferase N-terminal domain-containing protein [Pseudomonadota bacterium]